MWSGLRRPVPRRGEAAGREWRHQLGRFGEGPLVLALVVGHASCDIIVGLARERRSVVQPSAVAVIDAGINERQRLPGEG